MKKNLLLVVGTIFLLVTMFSGCEEQKGTTTDKDSKITLESEVVELTYASKEFIKDDQGTIIKVEVQYLFKNIANKDLEFYVTAEFYDKDGNLIFSSDPPKFFSLPDGYSEIGIGPANKIAYDGTYLMDVDHIVIKAVEVES